MGTRQVLDVVDGGGLYFSRAVTAGPYVFLGGVAADEAGRLAREAQVGPPYAASPQAHVVAQTEYIFNRYKEALEGLGSGINEMLQVEQHIPRKVYADGYIDTSRGKGFMDRGRPSSALLQTGELLPDGCVINPTGIALIPGGDLKKEIPSATGGYHESLTQQDYGETYAEEGPFNEIVTGGGYVFTVGDIANDWAINQIPEGVRVKESIWWGNEIRNETNYLLGRLRGWLERVDSGLENVVHVSVYLIDMADLYELDREWKRVFGDNLPGRTVIPCRGLGQPRFEGENLGHADNAVKCEFIARSIVPGNGLEKEIVSTGDRAAAAGARGREGGAASVDLRAVRRRRRWPAHAGRHGEPARLPLRSARRDLPRRRHQPRPARARAGVPRGRARHLPRLYGAQERGAQRPAVGGGDQRAGPLPDPRRNGHDGRCGALSLTGVGGPMKTEMYCYLENRDRKVLPETAAFEKWLDPAQTAVLCIDMHRGHIGPDEELTCDAPRARARIAHHDVFHAACRDIGMPVIMVQHWQRHGGADDITAKDLDGGANWRHIYQLYWPPTPLMDEHSWEGTKWLDLLVEHDPERDYYIARRSACRRSIRRTSSSCCGGSAFATS